MIKKVLHTSDWHIGRKLKEHDRLEEFKKFFDWLEKLIHDENIEALLVAGDIFDNTNPSTQAQNLYYSFLSKIAKFPSCRHVIIISGNHDSPAFIDAPSELLKLCKIHVIGQACENPEKEIIELRDNSGELELVVCAVPYLRDRDVRVISAFDNPTDTERALTEGIKKHYSKVFESAQKFQDDVPVIAMGHIFVRGGKTQPDDGVRSLYVGTALQIDGGIFPDWLTYTALGHLHSPQTAGRKNIRYSGSPLAMGFGEAGQTKSVYILELDGKNIAGLREINVPEFQKLERIHGDLTEIFSQIQNFNAQNKSIWLEITYDGNEIIADLQEKLQAFTTAYPNIEILSVHNECRKINIQTPQIIDGLEKINPLEMLELRFNADNTSPEQREIFRPMYKEILHEIGADN